MGTCGAGHYGRSDHERVTRVVSHDSGGLRAGGNGVEPGGLFGLWVANLAFLAVI